ncbi:MAG: hypothetical protein H0T94_02935 [Acidimicrobiia bacterium]|nr:hypothetical protein [Acidimicrobiia bacterium]MDQ3501505.1 hypothetical protein [Actinomycetota bacterium]
MARFFDTRAAYNMFVNATDEKTVVADRVASVGESLQIGQPGLRIFDAGMGDGALLTNVMRRLHRRFIYIPWLVVAKEISIEDVRQGLARLPDRFLEHPELVVVVTNLRFPDATRLRVGSEGRWRQVALAGDTSAEFAEQIEGLYTDLADDWEVRTNARTGNPVYVHPAAVVLFRADHEFLLEPLLPDPGKAIEFDLAIASQAYRAATDLERKVGLVIAPIARALAPGGRLIGVQAAGDDPGLEIIRAVWPDENPFPHRRWDVLAEARRQLAGEDLRFSELSDEESIFRFSLHTMPSAEAENIGTSSVLAAWNAATYVAQIDEKRLAEAMAAGTYLDATREVMEKYDEIYWNDESYVIEGADSLS